MVTVNTRKKATQEIISFLQGNEKFLLLTGTYQNQKHILALSIILSKYPTPATILFRANHTGNIESFMAPILKLPRRPRAGIPFRIKGGYNLYFDTINLASWRLSPNNIDIAIVYPIDSLDYDKGDECVHELLRRNPQKVFLISWTDNKDFGWTSQFNPVYVVFDAEEERPDYHQRMIELLDSTPTPPTITKKLPKYAISTPDRFLVKILCRGRCRSTSWARLNLPYPGKSAVRSAPIGKFRAVCLKCGYEATDNYNWYR